MARQSGAEILFNNFRKMVNDGSIYVLEKRNNELVCLKEVKYLIGNELNELENVARTNKVKYDKVDNDKRLAKEKELNDKFLFVDERFANLVLDLKAKHDKQKAINLLLLDLLKITYGTSANDFGVVIAQLEKEING